MSIADAMAGKIPVNIQISKPKMLSEPRPMAEIEKEFEDYPAVVLDDLTPGQNPWLD